MQINIISSFFFLERLKADCWAGMGGLQRPMSRVPPVGFMFDSVLYTPEGAGAEALIPALWRMHPEGDGFDNWTTTLAPA
jgi:hypothetical protein